MNGTWLSYPFNNVIPALAYLLGIKIGLSFNPAIKIFDLQLLADFTVSSNSTRVVVITYSSVDRVLRQVDHITPNGFPHQESELKSRTATSSSFSKRYATF